MADLFQWDKENISHLARHGVSIEEFEQVFSNTPVFVEFQKVDDEQRSLEIGHTATGRVLVVVWAWRGEQKRAVTAYSVDRAMRRLYKEVRNRDTQ